MDNFEEHQHYRLFPAMKLDVHALIAFKGAEYHLWKVRELYRLPCIQRMWRNDESLDPKIKRQLQTNANMFHWHIRAFFWELTALFDTILNWANQRYGFGFEERKVTWGNVRDASANSRPSEWAEKQAMLESAYSSDWFYEVRKYRNFAHRGFIFINTTYDGHFNKAEPTLIMLSLPSVREYQRECQDMIEQISEYLERMRELGESVFS